MNNEDDFFLKQMKGVTPIKKNIKLSSQKKKIKNKIIKENKKTTKAINPLSEPKKKLKQPEFTLEKISIGKNIKKRFFKIDKKIDFHGKGLLEAEEIFSSTITECFSGGDRCLLFVTGKGLFKRKNNDHSAEPKLYHGVIRAAFVSWVKSNKFLKYILSFERASIEHGGDGAFYVYLRKNKN